MYDLPQGKWRDMNPCRLGVTMTLPRGMIIGICVQNIYSLNTEVRIQFWVPVSTELETSSFSDYFLASAGRAVAR